MNTPQLGHDTLKKAPSVFGAYAVYYYSKNYNVIPCRGKAPFFKNWQRYSNEKIDSESFKAWLEDYSTLNIGLVLGSFSSTSAIDIDSDSPALIEVLPSSIVTIRGKKGEAPLFRFNPKVKRQRGSTDCPVDLLTENAVKIIAPSIHPDTQQKYVWKGKSLLDVAHADLPLMPDNINEILKYVKENPKLFLTHVGKEENGNRNNILVAMCSRLCFLGEKKEIILKQLKEYDLFKHRVPLFTSGETTAEKLYENVMKSIGKPPVWEVKTTKLLEEAKAEEDEELDDAAIEETVGGVELNALISEYNKNEELQSPPVPKSGLIRDMVDIIETYSPDAILGGAVSGAFSIMSAVLGPHLKVSRLRSGHRDQLKKIEAYGNLYSVFLAPSATGKSYSFRFYSEYIESIIPTSRVGVENGFASAESLVAALHDNHGAVLLKQPEAAKLFKSLDTKSMKHGGALMDALNDIWSNAGGKVKLNKAMIRRGRVDNELEAVCPYMTFYGTLTPDSFMESITQNMAGSGLFGRILWYYAEKKEKSDSYIQEQEYVFENQEKIIENIRTQIKHLIERLYPVTEAVLNQGKIKTNQPVILPHTMSIPESLCKSHLIPLQKWLDKMQAQLGSTESAVSMYINRGMEQILRLSLIVEASKIDWTDNKWSQVFSSQGMVRGLNFQDISVESFEYAIALWKYNLWVFYRYVVTSIFETEYERLTESIIQYIESFQEYGVLRRNVGQKFIRKKDTPNILRTLIEFKQVFVFKKGQRTYFVLDKYAKLFAAKNPLYKKQGGVSLNRT